MRSHGRPDAQRRPKRRRPRTGRCALDHTLTWTGRTSSFDMRAYHCGRERTPIECTGHPDRHAAVERLEADAKRRARDGPTDRTSGDAATASLRAGPGTTPSVERLEHPRPLAVPVHRHERVRYPRAEHEVPGLRLERHRSVAPAERDRRRALSVELGAKPRPQIGRLRLNDDERVDRGVDRPDLTRTCVRLREAASARRRLDDNACERRLEARRSLTNGAKPRSTGAAPISRVQASPREAGIRVHPLTDHFPVRTRARGRHRIAGAERWRPLARERSRRKGRAGAV